MKKLINIERAPSLMEEKARLFATRSEKKDTPALIPEDPCTVLGQVKTISGELSNLSRELKILRDVLTKKEKQFFQLANYKYTLQRSLISPTLVTSTTSLKERKKKDLLERLEALSPAQLEKLEAMKL